MHARTLQARALFPKHTEQHESYIMSYQSGDEDTEGDASPRTVRPTQTQNLHDQAKGRQTHKDGQTSHRKQTTVADSEPEPPNAHHMQRAHDAGKSHGQNVADDALNLSSNKGDGLNTGAHRDAVLSVGGRVRFGGGMRTLSDAYEYVVRPMEVSKLHEGQYVFVLKNAGKWSYSCSD